MSPRKFDNASCFLRLVKPDHEMLVVAGQLTTRSHQHTDMDMDMDKLSRTPRYLVPRPPEAVGVITCMPVATPEPPEVRSKSPPLCTKCARNVLPSGICPVSQSSKTRKKMREATIGIIDNVSSNTDVVVHGHGGSAVEAGHGTTDQGRKELVVLKFVRPNGHVSERVKG